MALDPQMDMFEEELRRARATGTGPTPSSGGPGPQYFKPTPSPDQVKYFNPGRDVGVRSPMETAGMRARAFRDKANAVAKKGMKSTYIAPAITAGTEVLGSLADQDYLEGDERTQRYVEGGLRTAGSLGGAIGGAKLGAAISGPYAPAGAVIGGTLGGIFGDDLVDKGYELLGKKRPSAIAAERREAEAPTRALAAHQARPFQPNADTARYITGEINKLEGGFRNPDAQEYMKVLEQGKVGPQLVPGADGKLQFTGSQTGLVAGLERQLQEQAKAQEQKQLQEQAMQQNQAPVAAEPPSMSPFQQAMLDEYRAQGSGDNDLRAMLKEYARPIGQNENIFEYAMNKRALRGALNEAAGLRREQMQNRTTTLGNMMGYQSNAEQTAASIENNKRNYDALVGNNLRTNQREYVRMQMQQEENLRKAWGEGYKRNMEILKNLNTVDGKPDMKATQEMASMMSEALKGLKNPRDLGSLDPTELMELYENGEAVRQGMRDPNDFVEKLRAMFGGPALMQSGNLYSLGSLRQGEQDFWGSNRLVGQEGVMLSQNAAQGVRNPLFGPTTVDTAQRRRIERQLAE